MALEAREYFRLWSLVGEVWINPTEYPNKEAALTAAGLFTENYDEIIVVRVTLRPVRRFSAIRTVVSEDVV